MKAFFDKFEKVSSAEFIGIENYENSQGEVANLNVLINVNITEAKKKDLAKLKAVTEENLKELANSYTLPLDIMEIALEEMINSGEKNLSENKEDRTNQSQAQTDAYIHLTPSIKMHKETMNVFITGLLRNKNVLVKVEYPERNKRVKTLCKDAIKKHCKLRMEKQRMYNVGQLDKINITGSTLQMV